MNTTTTNAVNNGDKMNSCKFVNIGFKRSNDGLFITIQSPIDWKIFKREDGRKFNLGGVACFLPRNEKYEEISSSFSSNNAYESEGMPNLTVILAENIKQGVTFKFPPLPISDGAAQNWLNQFKEDIKILFLAYVKPIDYSVVITSQTIERETHS